MLTSKKYLFLIVTAFYGCASVQTPMGGPKDTTPPKVVKMVPENLKTNFIGNKITIDFDEYFRIQNEFKEVTLSPEQEQPLLLKQKQKRLEITFPDTLSKNTTYTINFGNAIADINESNVLKNFTYVFSTGPVLDSLTITGNVQNAFTHFPELDALVFAIPVSADSIFGKKKPPIYTRTDSSGNYQLKNMRADSYKVYALKERNDDKIYQQGQEEIGFLKDVVILNANRDSVNFSIFKEVPDNFRILDRKINPDGTILLTFNRSIRSPFIAIADNPTLDAGKLIRFNKTNDSLRIWLNDLAVDSLQLALSENNQLLETATLRPTKKEVYKSALIPSDNQESLGIINPNTAYRFTFPVPVTAVDLKKITLLEDTLVRTNFTIEKDPSDFLNYTFLYPWKEKAKYEIRFAEGSFTGLFDSKNKYFSKKIELAPADSYNSIEFKISVPEKDKNYLFEFLNEAKNVVLRSFLTSDTTLLLQKIKAGNYYVRIIFDENKNNQWDTGNLSGLQQPEKIWYDPRSFSIKPNWEKKEIITIPSQGQ